MLTSLLLLIATASSEPLPPPRLEAPPELVAGADPVYPDEARAAGRSGDVVLRIVIADDGQVDRVDVVSVPAAGEVVDAAAVAVRVGCDGGVVDDVAAAKARVQALIKDPRFGGLRTEENFSEKLKDRLWRWFERLLESDAMQGFADNTRLVYIVILSTIGSLVAARLLMRARKNARDDAASSQSMKVERARQRAFALWRADALPLVDDDAQARRALMLLRAALLARVGESDKDAVKPQRTSTEILERLSPHAREMTTPALSFFDDAWYAGDASSQSSKALLQLVDAAAAALASSASSSSSSSSSSVRP